MKTALSLLFALLLSLLASGPAHAAPLLTGVSKVDITGREAGPVNDVSYAKALFPRATCHCIVSRAHPEVVGAKVSPMHGTLDPDLTNCS